jgi:hypothetical protein
MTIRRYAYWLWVSFLICAGYTTVLFILYELGVSASVLKVVGEVGFCMAYVVSGGAVAFCVWWLIFLFGSKKRAQDDTNKHNYPSALNIIVKLRLRYSFRKIICGMGDKVSHMKDLINGYKESANKRNKSHCRKIITLLRKAVNHNRGEPGLLSTPPPRVFLPTPNPALQRCHLYRLLSPSPKGENL